MAFEPAVIMRASLMKFIGPVFEQFLHRPVVIETPAGQVIGVLVDVDRSEYGELGCLLVQSYAGSWTLIKSWTAIKSARSS